MESSMNGPMMVFQIALLSASVLFNVVSFRCHPCNCGRRRCQVVPLFLAGNLLTLALHIPDILAEFDVHLPFITHCSFTFVASYLLCTYFVTLGVVRRVLVSSWLQTYRLFFWGCLFCAPLLSAGIQAIYANAVFTAAVEEPLMLQLLGAREEVGNNGNGQRMLIPLASCAKHVCGSEDVVLTVLSGLVPSLVPIIALAVCSLVSYSARKRLGEKTGGKEGGGVAFHPLIPEYCEREQNCWPILKFVLVLFFTWTVVAKPVVILLTHFTRQYYATATSNADNGSTFGLNETTIYVCTNFWDIGNHIILFISATLTPLVFVCSGKPIPCGQRQEFSLSSKKSTKINGVDRPVTVMGSINDMDIGTFTWDTFTFAPPREKQIALRGLEGVAQKSTTA